MKLGAWSRKMDLIVVGKDDLDMVFGMDFLLEHKVIPIPLTKCIVIPACIKQPDNSQNDFHLTTEKRVRARGAHIYGYTFGVKPPAKLGMFWTVMLT